MSPSQSPEQISALLTQILNIARHGDAGVIHQVLAQMKVPGPDGLPIDELRHKLLSIGCQIADQNATALPIVILAAELHWQRGDETKALHYLDQALAGRDHPDAHLLAATIHVRNRNLDQVHHHVSRLTATLDKLVDRNEFGLAINLQRQIYMRIGREYEDEDFVYGVMHPIHQILDRAGRKFAALNDQFSGRPARNQRHRIAFIFPVGVLLAHSEVVLMMCTGLSQLADFIIEPVIYVFDQIQPNFLAAFTTCNVEVIAIPRMQGDGTGIFGQMINLRHMLREAEIDTAVWVSVPTDANFYFGYRIAPRQVYWSMKFHTLITDSVDHLVSCGSWAQSEKMVHDRRWVIGSVAFANPLQNADLAAARQIRSEFGRFKTLMGVLAREEKINSRPYLEAVAQILEQNPDSGFVWTGRTEHPVVKNFFAERGLSDRAIWVGWVHTATYIHALDIFLETFPFGCGMTSTQALAAGKPLISYRDWTTVMGHHFAPVLEGRAGSAETRQELQLLFTGRRGDSLFLMADDIGQYVGMANKVIGDPILREDLSHLGKTLAERYLSNSQMAARRFAEIFREIDSGP